MSKVTAIICASAIVSVEAKNLRGAKIENTVNTSIDKVQTDVADAVATSGIKVVDQVANTVDEYGASWISAVSGFMNEEDQEKLLKQFHDKVHSYEASASDLVARNVDNVEDNVKKTVESAGLGGMVQSTVDSAMDSAKSSTTEILGEKNEKFLERLAQKYDKDPSESKAILESIYNGMSKNMQEKTQEIYDNITSHAAPESEDYKTLFNQFLQHAMNGDVEKIEKDFHRGAKTLQEDVQEAIEAVQAEGENLDLEEMQEAVVKQMKESVQVNYDDASYWNQFKVFLGVTTKDEVIKAMVADLMAKKNVAV